MQVQTVGRANLRNREADRGLVRPAQLLLIVAALLVGAAIISDGTVSRVLNGVGALVWVGAAVLLGWSLRAEARAGQMAMITAGAAIVLAALIRPDDLVSGIVAFGLAGVIVAFVAPSRAAGWAMLVPALYLPAHVIIAIGRSLVAGSLRIRTEPPPTAAFVPLAMVLTAALAGLVVGRLRDRRG